MGVAAPTLTVLQVVLQVGVAKGDGTNCFEREAGDGCASKIGVQYDARRIEHRAEHALFLRMHQSSDHTRPRGVVDGRSGRVAPSALESGPDRIGYDLPRRTIKERAHLVTAE